MAKKNIRDWIPQVEAARPVMDELVAKLNNYGATVLPDTAHRRVVGTLPYLVQFRWGETRTTIRVCMMDSESDSDVTITNMTTLPEKECGKGYGSIAIQQVLCWAFDNGLKEIRAVQVDEEREGFWQRNGFSKCPEPNPCNDFIALSNIAAPK